MGLPAGYTYLLQFIAHDISRSPTEGTATLLTPALDLDGILGHPDGSNAPQGPQNGEDWEDYDSGVWLGKVTAGNFRDLPRAADGTPQIPDRRNDQNLGVAQIHVLLTRFYHAVFRKLAGGDATEAKRITRNHFRWLVLHDVAPRIVDPLVWRDVMDNGPAIVPHGPDFLPTVEFTAACFRFGHALPRSFYNWNSQIPMWSLQAVLAAAGSQVERGALPDWQRMLHLQGHKRSQARSIGEDVTGALRKLSPHHFEEDLRAALTGTMAIDVDLGVQTLLRGHHCSLPSGQQLSEFVTVSLAAKKRPPLAPPLSHGQLLTGLAPELGGFLAGSGGVFLTSTPLWFYVLREAALLGSGLPLGPLASRIVMETLHAAAHVDAAGDVFSTTGAAAFKPDDSLTDECGHVTLRSIWQFTEASLRVETCPETQPRG